METHTHTHTPTHTHPPTIIVQERKRKKKKVIPFRENLFGIIWAFLVPIHFFVLEVQSKMDLSRFSLFTSLSFGRYDFLFRGFPFLPTCTPYPPSRPRRKGIGHREDSVRASKVALSGGCVGESAGSENSHVLHVRTEVQSSPDTMWKYSWWQASSERRGDPKHTLCHKNRVTSKSRA